MEVTNLMLCNNVKEVVRLLKLYSTDETSRKNLISSLLTKNIFNLKKVECQEGSNESKILDVFLFNLGLKLKNSKIKSKKLKKKYR